jgi:hypothetical protein
MPKIHKRVLIPVLLISFLGIAGVLFFNNLNISKGEDTIPPKELLGYAWNNNFGWLSLNCRNNNVCTKSNYKVSVDNTGLLSGYAWSENVGWISFNAGDLTGCPSGGDCNARISDFSTPFTSTKLLTGWAKILNDNSWIHLSYLSNNNEKYGAKLHSDGSISGYAWSENNGWISFEGNTYGSKVDGIHYLFPITLLGSGFKQGDTVSLINKNENSDNYGKEYECIDQNNNNTFVASEDGKTLTGSCPLAELDYGNYDIKVTAPSGQSVTLSSSAASSTELFTVTPPSATDVTITTPNTSADNTGLISITKISSSNSLMGASVSLMKDGKIIPCFTIHEYDSDKGWIPGKDSNGNVLPMTCDLTDAKAGKWNFVISSKDKKWTDEVSSLINVNCVPKLWTASWGHGSVTYNSINAVNSIDSGKIYGTETITDNCGNTARKIQGTCTPTWSPSTSCISSFQQTADNCLNKPTRQSVEAGIYGTSCDRGYMCQSNIYVNNYGTCIVDPSQCTKDFACSGKDCGSATDLCGNTYDNCGKGCHSYESCNNNKCESKL